MATIYTIGHSTHSLDELADILTAYHVTRLVDVRSIPRSRHTPQFNLHSMSQTLPHNHDIKYTHLGKLGGRRYAHKDSINQGWHNASFRGYADYMQTDEFVTGLDELLALASDDTVAIMCAEAVPWRCHRSMVGDALLVRGHDVKDIFNKDKVQNEAITSFAKVDGHAIIYPDDTARR